MKEIIITLTSIILISSTIAGHASSKEKMVLSIDLIRHGDRTPSCKIPKSPHHWNEGIGELTEKGKQQEMQLGKNLRKFYIDRDHLLPNKYVNGTIYVRSTGVKRTEESAKYILLGLYPLQYRTKADKDIPIHTVKLNNDNLLIASTGYNIFSTIKKYFRDKNKWKLLKNANNSKLTYWSERTGITLNSPQQLDCLADNLNVRLMNNIPLPEGISQKDAKHIISLSDSFILSNFNETSYPMGNEFLKTVNSIVSATANNKTNLKYALFVGHDSSIMSVLHALAINIKQVPKYAARLNFSLYSLGNGYRVKITYNGSPINIIGCQQNICTLDQFKHITERNSR